MAEKDKSDISQWLLYGAVSQASGIEKGKWILLENPIRDRKKYALLREWRVGRGRKGKRFPPEVKDFNIHKGKSYITFPCLENQWIWIFSLETKTASEQGTVFTKVQFK